MRELLRNAMAENFVFNSKNRMYLPLKIKTFYEASLLIDDYLYKHERILLIINPPKVLY